MINRDGTEKCLPAVELARHRDYPVLWAWALNATSLVQLVLTDSTAHSISWHDHPVVPFPETIVRRWWSQEKSTTFFPPQTIKEVIVCRSESVATSSEQQQNCCIAPGRRGLAVHRIA